MKQIILILSIIFTILIVNGEYAIVQESLNQDCGVSNMFVTNIYSTGICVNSQIYSCDNDGVVVTNFTDSICTDPIATVSYVQKQCQVSSTTSTVYYCADDTPSFNIPTGASTIYKNSNFQGCSPYDPLTWQIWISDLCIPQSNSSSFMYSCDNYGYVSYVWETPGCQGPDYAPGYPSFVATNSSGVCQDNSLSIMECIMS